MNDYLKMKELVKELDIKFEIEQDTNYVDSGYGTINLTKLLNRLDNFEEGPIPYGICSDEDIESFITKRDFIDTIKLGICPELTVKYHAQRIASLINKISNDIEIDPICVDLYDYYGKNYVAVEDGYHRLRANLYLKKEFIRVYIFTFYDD